MTDCKYCRRPTTNGDDHKACISQEGSRLSNGCCTICGHKLDENSKGVDHDKCSGSAYSGY